MRILARLLIASAVGLSVVPAAAPSLAAYQTSGRIVDWVGSSLTDSTSNWVDAVSSKELAQTNTTYSSSNGGYVTLNGTSSFVKATADLPSFTTTTMSVFLWIKPTTNGGVLASLGRDRNPDDADSEFVFSINSSGNLFYWDFNGTSGASATSSGTVTLNQWNYVGFTKTLSGSNSSITMYINGLSSGTPGTGGSRSISLNSFTIGRDPRDLNLYFSGGLQRATVWNSALSASQVQENYQTTNGFYLAPSISISNNNQSVNVQSAISSALVTNTGGAIGSFSVSPALPSGISIDANGTISGTPVVKQGATTYTISASNVAGTSSASFTLLVLVAMNTVEFANVSSPRFRKSATISVSLPASGKATFLANGKRIPGCIKVPTLNSNGITASCTWRASARGSVRISVIHYPSAVGYSQFTSHEVKVWIEQRTDIR